jgi:hypothetical protein
MQAMRALLVCSRALLPTSSMCAASMRWCGGVCASVGGVVVYAPSGLSSMALSMALRRRGGAARTQASSSDVANHLDQPYAHSRQSCAHLPCRHRCGGLLVSWTHETVSMSVCLDAVVCMSLCLFVCMSVCLYVCMSVATRQTTRLHIYMRIHTLCHAHTHTLRRVQPHTHVHALVLRATMRGRGC